MSSQVQVLILGAGPAGCSAALTLRRWMPEVEVMLVDRRPVGDKTQPDVGETLSPGVLPLLQFLGLGEAFQSQAHLPAGGTASAWGSDQAFHRAYLFTGMGHGWQLDRRRFDAWLQAEAVSAGARLVTGEVPQVRRDGEGFAVEINGESMAATTLIDASGRQARLARALGAQVVMEDRLIASARWFTVPGGPLPSSDGALIASIPDGWWYTAFLPGGRGVQMLMSDAGKLRRTPDAEDRESFWDRCLKDSSAISERTEGWLPTGDQYTCQAGSQHTLPVTGPGWVAAGDAAAAFDPLSSMGIGFALSTGIEAARVVAGYLDNDSSPASVYAESMVGILKDYRDRLGRFYAMEKRWDTEFWSARRKPVATVLASAAMSGG